MAEVNDFIENLSGKHRKCYQILKYHIAIGFLLNVRDYHVKTVVLHHSLALCIPTNDVIDCLREMLQELLQAYESRELKQFNEPRINLLSGYGDCDIQKISNRRLIKVLGLSHDCNYFEKFI